MNLDEFQKEIVESDYPRIIVEAGAGSGKTRLVIERIRKLLNDGVEPQNIIAITFTNMAAEEMKERMKDIPNSGDCFIGTIHSFANKIFKTSGKEYKIYTEEIENQFMENLIMLYAKHLTFNRFLEIKKLKKQVDLGIINNIQFDSLVMPDEYHEMNKLMGRITNDDYKDTVYTLCKKANVLTFDELLEKTTKYFKEINGKVEYLFVDEFQDIGPLENNFFKSLNAENYFYVGDEKQCQPEGTKITMGDGSIKNIEDIKVGDTVLSYNLSEGYYSFDSRRGKGKKILEISRHYEKELVEIETENKFKSKYTKNHRCLAKIHYDGNENKSVVYIMQNQKGQYRVGSTKLFTFDGRNFGLRARMNTEKAINGWILDVYDNQSEAWLAEQICAYKFGIPQTTWTYKNVRYNDDDIDNLYEKLGDLTLKVKICLEYFGKDINYPIFTKNVNKHFSKKHLTEVRACNLIPEVMDIAVPYKDENNRFKNKYFQIKKINIIENNKMVYGLKVEKNETYVADNILTHNSLYAFKGSDVKYFTNLISNPNWKAYFLKNNYRSGRKIIDIATIVIKQASGIINFENICKSNNMGEVIVDVKSNLEYHLERITNFKDWFILVRTNKEIYEMEQKLNFLGIPFITFKRSELDLSQMREKLEENSVKLLTVHSSKGLESKNVLLYGNFPVRQKPYLINSDERKVMYVGCTRAIDKLIILN